MYKINVLTDTTVRDSLPRTTRLKVYSPLTESTQRSIQHQDEGPLLRIIGSMQLHLAKSFYLTEDHVLFCIVYTFTDQDFL